ncbi:hypothetical protein D9M72_582900 [compost metagenome]
MHAAGVTEVFLATLQIVHFQLHVHRVRGPAEEGHEFLFFHRAGHFRQHRLLAGLDQFPLAHVEIVFLDDLLQ